MKRVIRANISEDKSLNWLDVQNQIAIERDDINPFYDESAAGDYILELVGKIERDLDLSVVPSVQGDYGDVYIHLGDSHTNSGVPIGPIDFTDFSNELIDLVLEADSENDFINSYKENILAYCKENILANCNVEIKDGYREELRHGYIARKVNGKLSINKPRPYDDAEYHWALWDDAKNGWKIMFKGKVIDIMYEDDLDDIDEVADMLEMVNSGIEPIIVHN